MIVKLSPAPRFIRIAVYRKDKGLCSFRFRRDMLTEMAEGKRSHFLDLDGPNYCNAHYALGDVNFRISFLHADPDFDHLSGCQVTFSIWLSAVQDLLAAEKERCFFFADEEAKPQQKIWLMFGAGEKFHRLCADHEIRKPLMKTLAAMPYQAIVLYPGSSPSNFDFSVPATGETGHLYLTSTFKRINGNYRRIMRYHCSIK